METIRECLQNSETRVLLASLDLGQIAAIYSKKVCHLNLSPLVFLPQSANTVAELCADVGGHRMIMARTLVFMCWRLPTEEQDASI
jgi:hypothetical protein